MAGFEECGNLEVRAERQRQLKVAFEGKIHFKFDHLCCSSCKTLFYVNNELN